ncbi:MAG: shikimate dehydrogenase [Spiribacter sp.]|jgi:shikimate dehydrogenase|nr:shikimate dehydrogenase [Spiribacter sp.]MDR9488801.1 shikimate dehydrogenase [Spiribacter sp.]
MDLYAVFGHPVGHSLSPRIHQIFAEETAQQMEYERREPPEDGFAKAIDAFQQAGGHGANVTVPFKEQAWSLCDQRSERAERAGAVNTLVCSDDLYGDNTDGEGLINDFRNNLGVGLAGKRVLIIGAGGAARGVIAPLIAEQPASLTVANRSVDKAKSLAAAFSDIGDIASVGLESLTGERFEVVINATSSGLSGEVPPLPASIVADGATAYDMLYGAEPTPFLRWATANGAFRTRDGLGMLIEQAAASFELWRRIRPNTEPVIEALRHDMRP